LFKPLQNIKHKAQEYIISLSTRTSPTSNFEPHTLALLYTPIASPEAETCVHHKTETPLQQLIFDWSSNISTVIIKLNSESQNGRKQYGTKTMKGRKAKEKAEVEKVAKEETYTEEQKDQIARNERSQDTKISPPILILESERSIELITDLFPYISQKPFSFLSLPQRACR
jgi:hypothetical protein